MPAFVMGALCGALIILSVGVIVALLLGLCIMVAVGIAAHLLSRTSPAWSAPPAS